MQSCRASRSARVGRPASARRLRWRKISVTLAQQVGQLPFASVTLFGVLVSHSSEDGVADGIDLSQVLRFLVQKARPSLSEHILVFLWSDTQGDLPTVFVGKAVERCNLVMGASEDTMVETWFVSENPGQLGIHTNGTGSFQIAFTSVMV